MPRISSLRASFLIFAISQWRASSLIISLSPSSFHDSRHPPTCYSRECTSRPFSPSPTSLRRRDFVFIARAHHEHSSSSTAVLHPESPDNINHDDINSFSCYPPSQQQRLVDNKIHDDTTKSKNPAPLDLPRHIAFICDGNSRWSKQKSLPESTGHVAGADRVVHLIKALQQWSTTDTQQTPEEGNDTHSKMIHRKIEYCTLFAFSTENWSRPSSEISALFSLIERMAKQYRDHEAVKDGKVLIELLGNLDDKRIPEGARRELQTLELESKEACEANRLKVATTGDTDDYYHNDALTICLAINYGGRADILQAAQSLAKSIAAGEVSADAPLEESQITERLCTSNIPDPDLIVRTGGERRLSNFLLWNAAYAELYFSDLLWPDFDDDALGESLVWYSKRKRRFGGRR